MSGLIDDRLYAFSEDYKSVGVYNEETGEWKVLADKKLIDTDNLRAYKGEWLSAKKIKEVCGYALTTSLIDTTAYKLVGREKRGRPWLYRVL